MLPIFRSCTAFWESSMLMKNTRAMLVLRSWTTLVTSPNRKPQNCMRYFSVTFWERLSSQTQFVAILLPKPNWWRNEKWVEDIQQISFVTSTYSRKVFLFDFNIVHEFIHIVKPFLFDLKGRKDFTQIKGKQIVKKGFKALWIKFLKTVSPTGWLSFQGGSVTFNSPSNDLWNFTKCLGNVWGQGHGVRGGMIWVYTD